MPGFRNRLVLEIARGVRGFLNLEAGLTRGAVPGTEALELQVQEQKNRLALSREQLARARPQDRRAETRANHAARTATPRRGQGTKERNQRLDGGGGIRRPRTTFQQGRPAGSQPAGRVPAAARAAAARPAVGPGLRPRKVLPRGAGPRVGSHGGRREDVAHAEGVGD